MGFHEKEMWRQSSTSCGGGVSQSRLSYVPCNPMFGGRARMISRVARHFGNTYVVVDCDCGQTSIFGHGRFQFIHRLTFFPSRILLSSKPENFQCPYICGLWKWQNTAGSQRCCCIAVVEPGCVENLWVASWLKYFEQNGNLLPSLEISRRRNWGWDPPSFWAQNFQRKRFAMLSYECVENWRRVSAPLQLIILTELKIKAFDKLPVYHSAGKHSTPR